MTPTPKILADLRAKGRAVVAHTAPTDQWPGDSPQAHYHTVAGGLLAELTDAVRGECPPESITTNLRQKCHEGGYFVKAGVFIGDAPVIDAFIQFDASAMQVIFRAVITSGNVEVLTT